MAESFSMGRCPVPTVLITGVTGQDGSYLAEAYLEDGWDVHGVVRRSSVISRPRIDHLFHPNRMASEQKLKLHYGDIQDLAALIRIIDLVNPQVVINLAAQSHVAVSFDVPIETSGITGLGALQIFEAVRLVNKDIRIYQAGSSEMFGGMLGREILDEDSFFYPKSPYAAAKVFAHNSAVLYRESYGMHISNGILFNHESPRRGENFVSRKISLAVARIVLGKQKYLSLGNIHSKRDWGHAREYARAIKMIVESRVADDYVVATGESYSVLDFAQIAFKYANIDLDSHLRIDPKLFRPNEVEDLLGSPRKISSSLGWSHNISLSELVTEMVDADIGNVKSSNEF